MFVPNPLSRVLPVLILGCATVFSVGCHRASPEETEGDTKVAGNDVTLGVEASRGVEVLPAQMAAGESLTLPGRLVWNEDSTVRVFSPFGGRVGKIAAQAGDHVTAGQVLMELSSADYGSAQSDLQKAQASLLLAQRARERERDLLGHGVVAQKDAEQAESDFANAAAEAKRAEARLRQFGDNGATVDQIYRLRSPIAGVVVEKSVNPGQEVFPDQPGSPLFVVTDPTRLWLDLDAHEADLGQLNLGQPIRVTSPEYPGESFQGTLGQIADFVDPVTRAIRVRGLVPNSDRRLKGEMYVTATLASERSPQLWVDARSVILIGEIHYVFVETAERIFSRREVQTGAEASGRVAILRGIAAGDRIVTTGSLYLQQLVSGASSN